MVAALQLTDWLYLVLNGTDSSVIPPIPASGGGVLGRRCWLHLSMKSPLTQQWVEVCRTKLFLWRKQSQVWVTQEDSLEKSWYNTWKAEDALPQKKQCGNTSTRAHTCTYQSGHWTWWLHIQLSLDPVTGASQQSSDSHGRWANGGLPLQKSNKDKVKNDQALESFPALFIHVLKSATLRQPKNNPYLIFC